MLLRVENIHKRYGKEEVLTGVSFGMKKGETKVIIGPSGTGKSTLLRCINRLTPADQGRVWLEEEEITHTKTNINRIRAQIGFVFQVYNLLQQATALQNVELPLQYARVDNQRQRAMDALAKLGLADRAHHLPSELSGGQQQRVAIARSLVNEPSLILADEPTGNLDSRTGAEVMDMFSQLNEDGITLIVVTHDAHVASYAGRLVEFLDGKVVSDRPVKDSSKVEGEETN